MSYLYCWKCCGLAETRPLDGHTIRPAFNCLYCGTRLAEVSCLVCLDQYEVSALGEEIACHRGCGRDARRFRELADLAGQIAVADLERSLSAEFTAMLDADRAYIEALRPRRIPLDTESGTAYSLEESAKGDTP